MSVSKSKFIFNLLLREIEKVALSKYEPLKKNFVQRILVFTTSGTHIVDLKAEGFSRIANKLAAFTLT